MKKSLYILFLLNIIFAACGNKKASTDNETITPAPLKDQSEGMKILQRLTRIYGSISIGNPTIPSFIEGRYFDDDNYIVFQVRGDSIALRDSLEKITGSKLFRLEMINNSIYSQKELKELLHTIQNKLSTTTDKVLKENIIGLGIETYYIYINLAHNTPEIQKAFREKISDSPAIRFESSAEPVEQ